MKRNYIILFIGMFLAVGIAIAFGYMVRQSAIQAAEQKPFLAEAIEADGESRFVDIGEAKVLGEETQKEKGAGVLSSENFQIKEVSFGSDIPVMKGNNSDNLEVIDVRSEMLMTKNQKDYKFIVSWKTNKLAISEIRYAKAGGNEKSVKESGFGFVHSVILSDLESASNYTYQIKTNDQWGNENLSARYSMYTSQKLLSVFELISKEFSGIFGWAIKK